MKIKHLASSSEGNAHLVDNLMLDAGIPMNEIRDYINPTELNGILLTHEHQDHSKAVEDILRAGVPVYSSPGTRNALGINHHNFIAVPPLNQFNIDGKWSVKMFPVVHDAEEPVGFLVRNSEEGLVYITDTAYTKYTFTDISYYLVECNYSKRILRNNDKIHPAQRTRLLRSHFELHDVIGFLQATDLSQTKEIHLLHLSDGNSDEKEFRREITRNIGVPVKIAGK